MESVLEPPVTVRVEVTKELKTRKCIQVTDGIANTWIELTDLIGPPVPVPEMPGFVDLTMSRDFALRKLLIDA